MRTIAGLLTLLLVSAQSDACDSYQPPKDKTVTWTTGFVTTVRIPEVEFSEDSTIEDALDFLEVCYVMPQPITINGADLGESVLTSSIEYSATDVSPIAVLSYIADNFDAEIVIGAGVITLRPRNESAQQAETLKP